MEKNQTIRFRKWVISLAAVLVLLGIGIGVKPSRDRQAAVQAAEQEWLQEEAYGQTEQTLAALEDHRDSTEELAQIAGSITCTYKANDTGLTITGYEGELPTQILLPREIDGKPVTVIGTFAFDSCTDLTSVTIPDSITAIEDWAFSGCTGLTSVEIPNSVTKIGADAFGGTPWLKNQTDTFVICGDGVLLRYNGNASDVVIPASVKMISSAFMDSTSIESVTIPGSVNSVGAHAFDYCTSLTSVTISDGVTSIGRWAFSDCGSLTAVTIPNSVTDIGANAFEGTPWLENQKDKFVICGDGVLLRYNGSASRVAIPASVKVISGAFEGCTGVKSVTIPDSVTVIGASAFRDCGSLTSVTIPDSVTSIGDSAFFWCSSLTSVTVPDSITSIEDYAFAYCGGLTDFTIPNSVTSIGGSAFTDCTGLTLIAIPDSVTFIGDWAFSCCESLAVASIPEGCMVGRDAFPDGCTVIMR